MEREHQQGLADRRRRIERRTQHAEMTEKGMRCTGCGTVWYSALAEYTVRWAKCVACDSALHVERRANQDRRDRRSRLISLSRYEADAA